MTLQHPMCVNKELLTNQSNQNLIQCINQGLGNYNMQAKSRHLPAFINKHLLEHSHVLMDFLCLLSYYNVRVKLWKTLQNPKAKIFTLWPMTERACWDLFFQTWILVYIKYMEQNNKLNNIMRKQSGKSRT